MKFARPFFFFLFFLTAFLWRENKALAQRSKHGAKVVAAATIVNEYVNLTANAAAGATSIKVSSNTLNANVRFAGPLAVGDLIMIIQMQGATILGTLNVDHDATNIDSTWGAILNYNNCGNWEFAEVKNIPNGVDIDIDCPLKNSYSSAGVNRTQVIRVPRYSSLTINAGGTIGCDAWCVPVANQGGVCAIEVENNTIINNGGSINVSGNGFRGGQLLDNNSPLMNLFFSASTLPQDGAEKGEGIAGYETDYNPFGGMNMRGAGANGGGGANIHNGGGGGGGNGGNPASWNGHGMPDPNPAYTNAWNLQYANFATQTSSGGGQGGYAWSATTQDPTAVGPCNAAWGGQSRCAIGGYGGRPLDYSTGRLFLGGGGGSGDQDNSEGSAGANGGGLIYLMNYGTVTFNGTGSMISNGNTAANTKNPSHRDGAGGGGAGGTIILNSYGTVTGGTLTANGGNGGNQLIIAAQAEGPGGGGGGGYIAISNGAPTISVTGGLNGTTTSTGLGTPSKFPPNGATRGGPGSSGSISGPFVINAANTTICAGQSATLTATLTGTVPGGTTISWYDALVAGNIIGTGATYVIPVLGVGTYTYYVGTCPGTYHQPVTVTVTNSPAVTASPNTTICTGGSTTLTASAGSAYAWSPGTGLSNATIANPVANPVATTTYVVTVTTPCGPGTATVVVDVVPSLTPTIAGNTTICIGGTTTLTASGGGNYVWNTGSSAAGIVVSPTANTTYSVNVTSGSCSASASVTVTVSSGITAAISPGNSTVCPGSPTTLTASGGSVYLWSTAETTASINVSPTTTTTYSVNVTSGSCSSTASVTVTIANNLAATINGSTAICSGGIATLTASGGGNYSWNTGQSGASIIVTPTATATYSVFVAAGTCTATSSITVNVGSGITVSVAGNSTICGGTSTALTASGGSNYSWSTGASTGSISVSPTPSTTTTYTVFGSSGSCADTATFTVNALPSVFTFVSGNNIICQGDAATLTASVNVTNNNTYQWSTGSSATTITVSPSATTTYSVIGFSGACSDTSPVTVTVLAQATATVSGSTTICAGTSTTISVAGGSVYSWSNGAVNSTITVAPLISSTFTVIAGIGACSDTDSVTVFVIPSPTVSVSNNTTICGGDMVTLNASGGISYNWSNGATSTSTVVQPASTTTYSVVTTSGQCNDTGTVTVTVLPPPNATINGNNNICQGLIATLTASGGTSYTWSSGETTPGINPSTAGTYSVFVSTGSCKDTAVITTTIVPNPTAVAFSNVSIIIGQSANLTASGGTNYVWDNSMTGASIIVSPQSTTVYCVTVYDVNNCQDTACVTVTVEDCSKAGTLYLPNAFSPNGDGDNDSLQIYFGSMQCIKNFHLVIYDRWGERVFETKDPAFKWNGVYEHGIMRGAGYKRLADTEVYAYYMDAELMDGNNISRKGSVSLLK